MKCFSCFENSINKSRKPWFHSNQLSGSLLQGPILDIGEQWTPKGDLKSYHFLIFHTIIECNGGCSMGNGTQIFHLHTYKFMGFFGFFLFFFLFLFSFYLFIFGWCSKFHCTWRDRHQKWCDHLESGLSTLPTFPPKNEHKWGSEYLK